MQFTEQRTMLLYCYTFAIYRYICASWIDLDAVTGLDNRECISFLPVL